MERISGSIYGAELLYPVKDKISLWNFEKLNGIGFYRGHDKYCYLEISIYEYNNYPDKDKLDKFSGTFVDWKVDEELFPVGMYQLYKGELFKYADFIIGLFSSLTGKQLNLIFEINFSGYHPTDNWAKGACGRALLNVVISCFDEDLYKQGLGHRANYYNAEKLEDIKRWTASLNSHYPDKK